MFPALLTFAETKCTGSFAPLLNAQAAASIVISNTPVEVFTIRFIAEFVLSPTLILPHFVARNARHKSCSLNLTPIHRTQNNTATPLSFESRFSVSQPAVRLVVRRTLSGYGRQMLWPAEFNGDILLRLDRPSIQESRLVTPLANGAHCRRKKGR